MKKTTSHKLFIAGMVLLSAILYSCENPVIEPEIDTTLKLLASTDSVACDPQLSAKEALQLTWTSGTNHGTGSAILYTIDIDLAENAFADAAHIEIGRTTDRTLLFSHKQLSDTLCKYFLQTEEDRYYNYAFRVRAQVVMTEEEQVSEPVIVAISRTAQKLELTIPTDMRSIDCLPMKEDQEAMHITWTKASNHGTDNTIVYTVEMDMNNTFAGSMRWTSDTTELKLSHRELVTALTQAFPSMAEGEPYTFYIRVNARIEETGEVQNSQVETIVIRKHPEGAVPLYLVGDATPNGWDRDHATCMISTWKGHLNRGEFKLLVSTDDFYPCYVRDPEDETKMLLKQEADGGPQDLKWFIYYPSTYTISVDLQTMTLTLQEEGGNELYRHIYMIGDATSGGWSWDNVTEMQHTQKNIFTYEGYLNDGYIKFPTVIQHDWNGEMIFAPSDNCEPVENGTFDIHSGAPDNRWSIPTAGTWRITINIQNTTISFVQL